MVEQPKVEGPRRKTDTGALELFLAMAPEFVDYAIDQLAYMFMTSEAASIKQDPHTTGVWNMAPVAPGVPPNLPPADLLNRRDTLDAFTEMLEEEKLWWLKQCKTKKQVTIFPDGTTLVEDVPDVPENGSQKLAGGRWHMFDDCIRGYKRFSIEPLNRNIDRYHGQILIERLRGLKGGGKGQPHMGMTDEEQQELAAIKSLMRDNLNKKMRQQQ